MRSLHVKTIMCVKKVRKVRKPGKCTWYDKDFMMRTGLVTAPALLGKWGYVMPSCSLELSNHKV